MGFELSDSALLRTKTFIDGEWVDAIGGGVFPVFNPADLTEIASVPDMGAQDTEHAIAAAERALPAWRSKTAKERAVILRRWYELIMGAQEDLARLMTAEQGKPLAEARGEVAYGAGYVEWFAEEARRVYGEVIPPHGADKRLVVIKQPVGVVAAITPWNFPNAMIARKVAPALAAGCTIVVKPAEDTPLSALALAVLAERAGVPSGVLNIVPGSRQNAPAIGKALTEDPRVRKLSFTGSTPVGKLLMGQSAASVKKISMELGGNAPFIVFDDADLDKAVRGALLSKFRNSGQTCICANRIYVQAGIYDAFAAKLAEAASQLRVGHGLSGETDQGPLINPAALTKVESHVQDAQAKGGTVLTGGKSHDLGGTFFEPTVITGVTQDMLVAREETFGPLAPLFKFETEEEVVAMANASEFGLAAYFYSQDVSRAWCVAEALESGMVGVNEAMISTEIAPFGGIKESGMGREGSRHGIEDYLEMKYICMGV